MTVTINGSTGIAGVDGSAGTPAIQGADANTGMFFPAADTIAFAEGGVEVMRIDSAGNVGIGTSSPTFASGGGLQVKGAGFTSVRVTSGSSTGIDFAQATDGKGYMYNRDNADIIFGTNNTERARIDSSGNLLVGTTSTSGVQLATAGGLVTNGIENFWMSRSAGGGSTMNIGRTSGAGTGTIVEWTYNGGVRGTVTTNGTNVAYNTSSDYRLKKDIAPMTGALARVAALKPVTYKWKVDGSDGEGFIAHELQAVVPDCVTGEKDAVDAEGKPVYQGIDTSFLVATLTAAIQEQQALIAALQADVAALKGAQA